MGPIIKKIKKIYGLLKVKMICDFFFIFCLFSIGEVINFIFRAKYMV